MEGRPKWMGPARKKVKTWKQTGERGAEIKKGSISHFKDFSFYPKGNKKSLKNL